MAERSHWPPLSRRQARALDRLAARNLRLLSVSDLVELDRLAGWALSCRDDGDWLCDDDGIDLDRSDLSPEQCEWLHEITRAVRDEFQRRYREGEPTRTDDRPTRMLRTPIPARHARVKARPRERRARRARSRARSPGRGDDDPHEPAPALGRVPSPFAERRLA